MADDTPRSPADPPERADAPFRFLDLSPEMRNHVYSHATESGRRKLEFLHFTQVCRQVRDEFRPIYMSATSTYMYGRELAAYLDVFHLNRKNENVSSDKLSTPLAITRYPTNVLEDFKNNSSYNRIKLLPVFLPALRRNIMELCRKAAKTELDSMSYSIASARVHCEIRELSSKYYFHLTLTSGMTTNECHTERNHPIILQWLERADARAIFETERGSGEKRSIWVGFTLSIK